MLKKLRNAVSFSQDASQRDAQIYRGILRDAGKLGGEVFGPIPAGHRREFFCLDQHTWVWHEEWKDENGQYRTKTTRYDVRSQGVFKAQDGQPYRPISDEEFNRLCSAAREYQRRLHAKFDPLLAV